MATSPQLEIDTLLEPIPGDEAAGLAVPFNIRRQLDEHRKEVLPESFSADDPMRPDQPKVADWPAIVRIGQETLKETSKDMLVAARLTEALTKDSGFGGLRDGLMLMRRLVEDCWDRVHPSIEDGDLEVRAAAFNWLDDADRGARFPYSIRAVGFIPGDDRKYSHRDWRDVMEGRGELSKEDIDKASQEMSREEIQDVVDDLKEGMAEIDKVVEILAEKMGDDAPGLTEVRTAMRDCLQIAEPLLAKKGPAESDEPIDAGLVEVLEGEGGDDASAFTGGGISGGGGGGSGGGRMNTRNEVYVQLEKVSARLLELDPHSPISYLVQRAVRLSKFSLPDLLKALIRNDDVMSDLSRDLDLDLGLGADSGIEETPSDDED